MRFHPKMKALGQVILALLWGATLLARADDPLDVGNWLAAAAVVLIMWALGRALLELGQAREDGPAR